MDEQHRPFDPENPFDANADEFRKKVGDMVSAAQDLPSFKAMGGE